MESSDPGQAYSLWPILDKPIFKMAQLHPHFGYNFFKRFFVMKNKYNKINTKNIFGSIYFILKPRITQKILNSYNKNSFKIH